MKIYEWLNHSHGYNNRQTDVTEVKFEILSINIEFLVSWWLSVLSVKEWKLIKITSCSLATDEMMLNYFQTTSFLIFIWKIIIFFKNICQLLIAFHQQLSQINFTTNTFWREKGMDRNNLRHFPFTSCFRRFFLKCNFPIAIPTTFIMYWI